MTALAWQTLLLLALAYFLGCWIACLVRRMISPAIGEATAVRATVPASQTVPVTVAPQPRTATPPTSTPVRDGFRRADTLEPSAASAPVPRVAPATPPAPVSAQVPTPAPVRPPAAPSEDRATQLERALTGGPATTRVLPAQDHALAAAAAAAASAAAATAMGAASRTPAPPSAPNVDDLKRIRTIDQGIEAALHRLGIRTYAQIGAWKHADVTRISSELGFKGRIEQENWIEQ
ncbi:MAG: hypothetical protein AB7F78_24140, partial [Hyphomicrobiaceae bacterium]